MAKTNTKFIHQKQIHKKLIEIVTISIFYLKFKENNENLLFQLFWLILYRPMSMAALLALAAADACLTGLLEPKLFGFQGKRWLSGAPL